MFKARNGFTKVKMIKAVLEGNNGTPARNEINNCLYLTEDGNKCAIGCFIPKGHPSTRTERGPVGDLLFNYPELADRMPLSYKGLRAFQRVHDNYTSPYLFTKEKYSLHEKLIRWILRNVKE